MKKPISIYPADWRKEAQKVFGSNMHRFLNTFRRAKCYLCGCKPCQPYFVPFFDIDIILQEFQFKRGTIVCDDCKAFYIRLNTAEDATQLYETFTEILPKNMTASQFVQEVTRQRNLMLDAKYFQYSFGYYERRLKQ